MRALLLALLLSPATGTAQEVVRFATFNASLNRDAEGALALALTSADPQVAKVLAIIEAVDPDVLLLNEFDYAPGNAALMQEALGGAYPFAFIAPSNTGVASGLDLNGDGEVGTESFAYANDAFGFGLFPGQYGMLVLSKYPLGEARTFQTFLWRDMPGARVPVTDTGAPFYSPEIWQVFRLSSKSHWDIVVELPGGPVHLLASHPTPPVFDGPEDRNGTRNADEIRFWADYVRGAPWVYDDDGQAGGLPEGARFVIAGDLNADPFDGDSTAEAARQVTDHELIRQTPAPTSDGAVQAAAVQGRMNDSHRGPADRDTADFGDDPDRNQPGNLRVDYVLASLTLTVLDAGVFWPREGDPGAEWLDASDHRLVWVDVQVP